MESSFLESKNVYKFFQGLWKCGDLSWSLRRLQVIVGIVVAYNLLLSRHSIEDIRYWLGGCLIIYCILGTIVLVREQEKKSV